MPITHPAAQQGEHIPIGLFGDDAKYTLAGAKVIVMLLNIVIQTTMRFLANIVFSVEHINHTHRLGKSQRTSLIFCFLLDSHFEDLISRDSHSLCFAMS